MKLVQLINDTWNVENEHISRELWNRVWEKIRYEIEYVPDTVWDEIHAHLFHTVRMQRKEK